MKSFKFWFELHSGNQQATEMMDQEQALEWLQGNQQNIVAMMIVEKMNRVEAMKYVRGLNNE